MHTGRLFFDPRLFTSRLSLTRYILIISTVILTLIGTIYVATKLILSRKFSAIEQQQVNQKIQRVLDALQEDYVELFAVHEWVLNRLVCLAIYHDITNLQIANQKLQLEIAERRLSDDWLQRVVSAGKKTPIYPLSFNSAEP